MRELTSHESTVNSFYLAFYGRPADPAGLKFWAEQLANNAGDHRAIIDAFATSREAQVRFGDDTPAERIAEIYQQLFNRAPEQSGVDYWADVVAQGKASLADVAIEILSGAQGTDKGLLDLRQQAVDAFTALVETSGSDYAGYSSIEAARVLVRAVTPGASQEDIGQLVKATVAFADIASNKPAVIDAIATGSSLLALFDTPRGLLDPVVLVQALADVGEAAAGNPATLESLLRGGGMGQVLKVMPANATLQDVVDALATGGLPAAIEVVYPSAPATPSPSAPVSSLEFDSVESGAGDRDLKDHITKVEQADVKFTYDGAIKAGQSFQYTIDGGKNWISAGIDTSTRGVVVLKDVDLTIGAQDLPPPPPPRMGTMEAGPVEDVLTTVELRLVDANKVEILSATETLVLDRFAEMLDVELVNAAAEYFPGLSDGLTNVPEFVVDGLEKGAIVQYLYQSPGANMATWVDTMPTLQDGKHTISVRQRDAAGNTSAEDEITFTLDTKAPVHTPGLKFATDSGGLSDRIVTISNLDTDEPTGWQYSTDNGESWKFGGVNTADHVQFDLTTIAQASGTLLVRQLDAAGNEGAASVGLQYSYDNVPPTETLAFVRIEGGLEGIAKTSETSADVVFSVAGKNDGIVQWRLKGEQDWNDVTSYDGATFTIAGVDLSQADQAIELQVVDHAGNVGDTLDILVDGPVAPFKLRATPEGLRVDSTVAGVIKLGATIVTSDHASQGAIDGRVVVGEQPARVSGTLSITPVDGAAIADESGTSYWLGSNAYDTLKGANLWGFAGNDTLIGTAGNDYLSGGDGNDEITSMGGADTISGGKEADTIILRKDGVASTLVYQAGDTATGQFANGGYMNGMDRIQDAELGDMLKVGAIFGYVDEIKSTFLTSVDADQVAVVRGNADSRFTADPSGTSYMVQWTDGVNINSIIVAGFGATGFSLEVDSDRGILTMVAPPAVISTFAGISYDFSADAASFLLEGTPDDVVQTDETNGMLPNQDFKLYTLDSGFLVPAAPGYDAAPGFGVDGTGRMHFADALAANVYMMSWGTDTFATASGSFDSAGILFAGGVDGHVVQQGIGLQSDGLQTWVKLDGGVRDRGTETKSLLYVSEAGTTTTVTTGVHQDVVDATAGAVTIVYNKLDSAAQDMIVGFGADDKIEIRLPLFPGKGSINANGPLVSDEIGIAGSATLATLKPQLDGRAISSTAGTVFLVQDGLNDAGMLIHYVNSDNDEVAEAGEVTLIATFTGGLPDMDQIILVGMP